MGNCLPLPSSPTLRLASGETHRSMPVDTIFKLPSALPHWPSGGGFARGTIDLGGLEVCQISSFTEVWATHEGGPGNLGATFFEPSPVPEGFFMLGCYVQPNHKPLFGWVLAGKDISGEPSGGALKPPVDYNLVYSTESSKTKRDKNGYIWLPIPPDGYKATGHVVTTSPKKPPLDKIRCVRSDFTDVCEKEAWLWGEEEEIDSNGINIYGLRPTNRGIQAQGVPLGTFVAQNGGVEMGIACLKNTTSTLSSMPNLSQIKSLVQAFSPWIYFHPNENYLPSSVDWFFENGVRLYKKGEESDPVQVKPNGLNLPQGGSNDGEYWLDLPQDSKAKERVKRGSLEDAEAYLHVKPMLGASFTDIAIWVFYPFNGPGKATVGPINNFSLGKTGEHIGDWEHLTLRISNFNGELKSVYFSQHSKGTWVSASELEFQGGNKPVTYSALGGHAFYPKPGLVLQGSGSIGIRNDTAKGKNVMDTGARFLEVSADYLGMEIVEPPWLNYAREWGPKIEYGISQEIKKGLKLLPGKLKTQLEEFIRSLPKELFGEEGPTGPKMKSSWSGDERV